LFRRNRFTATKQNKTRINISASTFVLMDEDEFLDVDTQTQGQQDAEDAEMAERAENEEKAKTEIEDPRGGPSNIPTVASTRVASGGMSEDPLKSPKNGFKSVKNSQKVTKNAKICPKLANAGEKCDKKSDCQFFHPSRCRHFAKFGNVSDFPKGEGCSWEVKCRFAHVKVCKKTTCSRLVCNLTHLQPKPKKPVDHSVITAKNQNGSQANHKRVQQRSNQDHVPRAIGSLEKKSEYSSSGQGSRSNINNNNNKSERSFLEPGLEQRLSRLEGMLEELMMTLIPNQQEGFPPMALNNINNNRQQNQVSHPLWQWRQ
jgi:hypothetical protein